MSADSPPDEWDGPGSASGRRNLSRMRCRCRGIFRPFKRQHPYFLPINSQHRSSLEIRLRMMASANDTHWLNWLLERGVSANAADKLGRTPLHMAASRGHVEASRVLLNYNADPNLKDVLGNTPLHLAACTSNLRLVTLLLDAGTDVSAPDGLGRSPLALAQSKLRLMQGRVKEGLVESNNKKWMEELVQVVDLIRAVLRRAKPLPLQAQSEGSDADHLHTLLASVSLDTQNGRTPTDLNQLLEALDGLHIQGAGDSAPGTSAQGTDSTPAPETAQEPTNEAGTE